MTLTATHANTQTTTSTRIGNASWPYSTVIIFVALFDDRFVEKASE